MRCYNETSVKKFVFSELMIYLDINFPFIMFNREKLEKINLSPEKMRAVEAGQFLYLNENTLKKIFCERDCKNKTCQRKAR